MTSGLGANRSFHRREKRKRQARWLAMLLFLIALGVFAYHSGSVLARREVVNLRDELAQTVKTVDELRHQNAMLQTASDSARREAEEWRARYQKDVPTGVRQTLQTAIERQIAAGVKPERLRFLIDAAASGNKCDGRPETKRFLVRTPLSPAADASIAAVRFADGMIVVTAAGEPATTPDGKPQAAFDPARPVTVRFAGIDHKPTQAAGTLPLYHSVVIKSSEYRFAVLSDDRRGFLRVTADRCSFP